MMLCCRTWCRRLRARLRLVHTGPFGNIAHGTSSVISQDMGLRLADYVVNEAGFAADLGAEKYMDIVTRVLGVSPAVAVLVTTVQSMRNQGEGNLEKGLCQSGAAHSQPETFRRSARDRRESISQ